MRQKKHAMKGFSLLETLLEMAIAAIILTFLLNFFINTLWFKNQHSIEQELQYNMQFILQNFGKEIKEASGVNTSASILGTSPGSLSLNKIAASENPTLLDVANGKLQLTRGTDPIQSLSTARVSVTQLIFTYQEPMNSTGIVTGSIRIQSTVNPTVFLNENFSFSLRINN